MSLARRHPLLAFFALSCAISWAIWAPLWLASLGVTGLPVLPTYHHALGAIGPAAAALIMTRLLDGPGGVRALLARLWRWRGDVRWILLALLGPLVLVAIAALGVALVTGEPARLGEIGRSREFPQFAPLAFLAYNMLSFGIGEEVGWRGFALPRLQDRHSALAATLLLTLGWAAWHAPLFLYRPGYVAMGIGGMVGWLVSLVTGAILLTWLYNRSGGNLLVVALFHASVDVAFTSDLSSPDVVNATGALITLAGLVALVAGRGTPKVTHGTAVYRALEDVPAAG